jgi:hypothetical protein
MSIACPPRLLNTASTKKNGGSGGWPPIVNTAAGEFPYAVLVAFVFVTDNGNSKFSSRLEDCRRKG